MSLSKAEREAGFRPIPQPSPGVAVILRRVARGSLMVTHTEDGQTLYCYEDGTVICDAKGRALTGRAVKRMINEGWLLPIDGGSFLEHGPPQQYRARTVTDGPLPRWERR